MRHAQIQRITTCGSGHFLLGAFHRLHERWQQHAPALGARELVAKALDSVYGVDINPFAVAIARFRLLVAALNAAGDSSIEDNIGYRPHLAAGDSLLWGAPQQALDDDMLTLGTAVRADATENAPTLRAILHRQHDVVVGNPPYITPKDSALNATYRQLYNYLSGTYALTIPFMELLFRLAYSSGLERPAGWVGQITSNSFMKRGFGKPIIEKFLSRLDMRLLIDVSGAYIPGHGTPTVILVGRNQSPTIPSVRAVLGIRGEPARPANPAKGLVWSSITNHLDEIGYEDEFITIENLNHSSLAKHPWSLTGGAAVEVKRAIESIAKNSLRDVIEPPIGRGIRAGSDEAFVRPAALPRWCNDENFFPVLLGEEVRDWCGQSDNVIYYPYVFGSKNLRPTPPPRELWPLRTQLRERRTFQGVMEDAGLQWWEYMQHTFSGYTTDLSIAFSNVATHNHFILDTGKRIFTSHSPVIKLPLGASLDDHLRVLGLLNSSIACFWLKQNSQNKGNGGIGGGIGDEDWEPRYEFTGTMLQSFPLPADRPLQPAKILNSLAQSLQHQSPHAVAAAQAPTSQATESAHAEFDRLRASMIAQQEELDWQCYKLYGLTDEELTFDGDVPGIALGERAFEIALARKMSAGEETTAWFARHGSTPTTEIPAHLSADYRALIQRRLDAIENNPRIRLLEKPEYKRRWSMEPWDKQLESALRRWLLDRVEDRSLWFDRDGRPTPVSVAQLADILDRDTEFCEVLRRWARDGNATTAAALAKLLADESVPFVAAYRYKPSGLDKRADWEHTWAMQRREDAGEKLDSPIPVPPKYASSDFVKTSYWSHRGKLDVAKERFISYPNAGRDSDASELLGWAGWDHAEQALALAALISARIDEGWDTPKLIPLLAGLHELQPWVRQWHNQIDPEYGESVADAIDDEVAARMAELHLTTTDLTSWRPPAPTRGRRARTP